MKTYNERLQIEAEKMARTIYEDMRHKSNDSRDKTYDEHKAAFPDEYKEIIEIMLPLAKLALELAAAEVIDFAYSHTFVGAKDIQSQLQSRGLKPTDNG